MERRRSADSGGASRAPDVLNAAEMLTATVVAGGRNPKSRTSRNQPLRLEWAMRAPKDCTVYGILDLGYVVHPEAAPVAREMIAGGVDILQLRAKGVAQVEIAALATALHALTTAAGIPLIINDHAEIARSGRAEGVHVGQDDRSVAEVRAVAGEGCVVGKSTHSLDQARRAADEGADYIGWGPLFPTPTKPDYAAIGLDQIETVHNVVTVPIFCIGGIKLDNLAAVIAAGARRVVIVSGLLQAPDIAEYARAARALLNPKSEIRIPK